MAMIKESLGGRYDARNHIAVRVQRTLDARSRRYVKSEDQVARHIDQMVK